MVPYPEETQHAVVEAVAAWREFLSLPLDAKQRYASEDAHIGSGFEQKAATSSRDGSDNKQNFDVTMQGIAALRGRSNSVAEKLLDASETLLAALQAPARAFVETVAKEYDVPTFSASALASERNRFIRFLYYPPVQEGTVIGQAHTDHSGYTFHLYESTGGCHRLSYDKKDWLAMPIASDEMAAFAGMQLQLVSDDAIKALCHEITANETTARQGCIAVVCFNMLAGVRVYDRATHGHLQTKEPGFNYQMDNGEFAKLFA